MPHKSLYDAPLKGPNTRFCRRAFTLIELLVVIAIIAVLAALAMPVLSKAKLAANQAKSMARLGQLQLANISYANDHNQMYVQAWEYSATINEPWFNNPGFLSYFGSQTYHWWGNGPEFIYSALVPLQTSQAMGTSFGINIEFMGWPPVPRYMLQVPFPARMVAFCESQDFIVGEGGSHGQYKVPEAYSGGTVAYRYNGLVNMVFYDGHVEALPQSKVAGNWMLWKGQDTQ